MWLFSDKYSSRSARVIIGYLKRHNIPKEERKRLSRAFLNGFEHGMNTYKNNPITTNTRIHLSQVEKILKSGIPISDVKMYPALEEGWFGICVGYVVGLLRFKPKEILRYDAYTDYCADFINALKDKPEFYEIIRIAISEWYDVIRVDEGHFESNRYERNYRKLVRIM